MISRKTYTQEEFDLILKIYEKNNHSAWLTAMDVSKILERTEKALYIQVIKLKWSYGTSPIQVAFRKYLKNKNKEVTNIKISQDIEPAPILDTKKTMEVNGIKFFYSSIEVGPSGILFRA